MLNDFLRGPIEELNIMYTFDGYANGVCLTLKVHDLVATTAVPPSFVYPRHLCAPVICVPRHLCARVICVPPSFVCPRLRLSWH
jgi:hypothetical protein